MACWSRRDAAAALVALPFCLGGTRAQPAPVRRPTPAQTEGPFYPIALPADADADLLRNGRLAYTQGQAALLAGTVTDLEGQVHTISGKQRGTLQVRGSHVVD